MSSSAITLDLQKRQVIGKQVRELRRQGFVPAVIHDHGKQSINAQAAYVPIAKAFAEAGKNNPIKLSLDGKDYMTLIKEVDFEPRKNRLRHVVFNSIKANEKQQTEVTVHLTGEIPAEKSGYLVIQSVDTVEIEALPKDLVSSLELDASSLTEIGDKLAVSDIKVPTGVTILTEPEYTLAVVEETKAQISEEAAETEATAASADSATKSADEEE